MACQSGCHQFVKEIENFTPKIGVPHGCFFLLKVRYKNLMDLLFYSLISFGKLIPEESRLWQLSCLGLNVMTVINYIIH